MEEISILASRAQSQYCTSYPQSNACAPQTGKGELDKELTVAHADTVFKPRNQT